MTGKLTYAELEQKVKELEKRSVEWKRMKEALFDQTRRSEIILETAKDFFVYVICRERSSRQIVLPSLPWGTHRVI